MAAQDAGAMLSVAVQPSADISDGCGASFVTEQDVANRFDDRHDPATVQSVPETFRRNSSAVELNCSVVDTVSRNRCSKMHTVRRKSMNEAVAADFADAGLHLSDSSEWCQRAAWRRTKSYDMSVYEVTVL